MSLAAKAIGLTGNTLLVVYPVLYATRALKTALTVRLVIAALVCALLWIPFTGAPAVAYVRGTIGDLSVTTLVLLVLGCWHELGGHRRQQTEETRLLMVVALAAGLTLYPWSLGLSPIDPYSWGYGSYVLAGVLFLLTLIAWLRRAYLVVSILLLAVSAYLLKLGESTNLWDYLVDPVLVVFAAVRFGIDLIKHFRDYANS